MKLYFHPYVEHQKQSPDVSWASILWQTGPGGRGRLEVMCQQMATRHTKILVHINTKVVKYIIHGVVQNSLIVVKHACKPVGRTHQILI